MMNKGLLLATLFAGLTSVAQANDRCSGSPICASNSHIAGMAIDTDTAMAALAAHEQAELDRATLRAADARDEVLAIVRAQNAPRVVSQYRSSAKVGTVRYNTVSQTVRENGTYRTETQSQAVPDYYAVTQTPWEH